MSISLVSTMTRAQSPLERRFTEDRFRHSLGINGNSPMFAGPGRSKEGFEYRGEWQLELKNDAIFDSNAFRDSLSRDDWHWDYGVTLGYEWWLSEESGVVITPAISAGGQRYDRYGELDGDMLGAGVTFAFKKMPIPLELSYAGGWGFEGGYGSRNYTEHVLGAGFGQQHFLRKGSAGEDDEKGPSLTWKLGAGYQLIDPTELEAALFNASLEWFTPITEKLSLTLGGGMGYRSYTHPGPEDRDTWLATASAALSWKISDTVAVTGSISYAHADDRISANDYDQVLTAISVSITPKITRFLGLPRK